MATSSNLATGKWAIAPPPGARPFNRKGKTKEGRFMHLRLARILRVDYINWCVDVQWLDGNGGRSEVPLCVSMGTHRTFAGFMPEERSIVVCGFVKFTDQDARPYVIGYLPNGFITGYDFGPINTFNKTEQIRCKMQKVYPGEGFYQSTQGTWERFDHHFQVYASDLTGLWMDAFIHALHFRSLNYVMRTAMGKAIQGQIIRNKVPNLPGIAIVKPLKLLNQKEHCICTVDDKTIDEGGMPWVEDLALIRETCQPVLDVTEQFDDDDQLYKPNHNSDLHIEKIFGTWVGHFPSDPIRYGRVLKFQVYTMPYNVLPVLGDVVMDLVPDRQQLAGAYHLRFLKSHLYGFSKKRAIFTPKFSPAAPNNKTPSANTTVNINKEGKLAATVAASSPRDPLGAGRSIELNLDGSVKMTIGSNANQEQSVVIDTSGGWQVSINGPDNKGFGLLLKIKGNVKTLIDGNVETEITGNELHIVHKNRTVLVGGHYHRKSNVHTLDEAPRIDHN